VALQEPSGSGLDYDLEDELLAEPLVPDLAGYTPEKKRPDGRLA
jgi:hypothetical protein